jgi:hypothetical protein
VPSEMLSGPDLGGGYLHQLTVDRDGDRTTIIFHAQDGGSDAGGPPPGPLDVFGFVHPPNPCQFGGPRCWHRRFLLPFSETPKARLAYNRSRFVLETMLAHAHLDAPVGIEPALVEVVRRLGTAAPGAAAEWYVGGSTAAWLLGADVRPRDIDLGTTREGVDRIAAVLAEYLIEPLATTDWSNGRIVRGARAFVGTFREGARVEWCVPIGPEPGGAGGEWSAKLADVRRISIPYSGTSIEITRPEYALVHAAVTGRTERIPTLKATVRKVGVDAELLERLIASAALPAGRAADLRNGLEG